MNVGRGPLPDAALIIYVAFETHCPSTSCLITMPPDQPPQGKRFSHVYIKRGEPVQDGPRMRQRLASLIRNYDSTDLRERAERDLGIPGPLSTGRSWHELLEEWELKDVLDLVTIVYRQLVDDAEEHPLRSHRVGSWLSEVSRIFLEENVHYRVDNQGGVHFYFDEEFAHNQAATIAALNDSRYANALHSFEGALAALSQAPPNGKAAIRSTFAAIEGLFRLMFPNSPRLAAKEVGKLKPLIQQLHTADATALGASSKMLNAFKEWIEAAHFYRHEPGKEEVAQPPLTLAVYVCSVGASHLRWLAELDASIGPKPPKAD